MQHVGAADEGRADDAVGHDVDLPDRRQIEDVALDHHVADHEHGEAIRKAAITPATRDKNVTARMKLSMGVNCPASTGMIARENRPAGSPAGRRVSLFHRERLIDQLLTVRHVLGEFGVGALLGDVEPAW